jgi:hypothetical protein
MNDFILFPDGTWSYEPDADLAQPHIKVKNPFVQEPKVELPKNPKIQILEVDYAGTCASSPIIAKILFTSDTALEVGGDIKQLDGDDRIFYHVSVTASKYDPMLDCLVYTGYPRYWMNSK